MENQVAKKESSVFKVEYMANNEQVKLTPQTVRQTLVRGEGKITDQEVMMFITLCKYQHLNPFLNEAYIIKFGTQPAQLITSKEAFMKRAESNPQYDGIKAGIIVLRKDEIVYSNGAFKLKDDDLVGAWAEVYRKDRKEPHRVEISVDEFNKSQSTWKTMPATMIRKTAMVNALREAFPEALGGLYTEDDRNPNETSAKDVTPQVNMANNLLKNAIQEPKKEVEVEQIKYDPRDEETGDVDIFKEAMEREQAEKEVLENANNTVESR
ncbi:phage recombination protein Bet [Ligilactobacillus sp. WILCCON 0076]|uniref:Phage recombination protein Bet n=1 Tax=Ligilactobacillus ubinensis TaxID=2876789 RepID=A0A9X2FJN6_9LACO|nr:phage recombination protein Bet [Ligilactobacillus ubinensis]MCP0886957.1 phage recombination protein Bet [Ligilactobacillus ubinensis]